MRPRFSLRTLLTATTLAALACAWMALPSWHARRLVRAVNASDMELAQQILANDDVTNFWDRKVGLPRAKLIAQTNELSLRDMLKGVRRATLTVMNDSPGSPNDGPVMGRWLVFSAGGQIQ